MTIQATDLPRAALSFVQPCAKGCSRSQRRRQRLRRTAVRHSIRTSLEVRSNISGSTRCDEDFMITQPCETKLRADADEFWLTIGFESHELQTQLVLDYLQLDDQPVDDVRKSESDVVFCRHPELGCGNHIGRRKMLGEVQLLGTLAELPLTSEIGYISKTVTRRCLRESEKVDSLPELPSADFSNTVVLTNVVPAAVSASCRGPGHAPCRHCYVPDGRFGRHRFCQRKCSEVDGKWGPTLCCESYVGTDIMRKPRASTKHNTDEKETKKMMKDLLLSMQSLTNELQNLTSASSSAPD